MKFIIIILFFLALDVSAQSDTLNRVDVDGKKTGYWIIYGKSKPKSGFAETSIIEEGKYDAGKKTGLWKTYHVNGRIKSKIEYKGNRPNGKFNTYYDNGFKEEEGTWKGTFYIDTFRRYDSRGIIVQEKIFNKEGKTATYKNVHSGIDDTELIFNSKPLYTFCECDINVSDTIYTYYDIVYKVIIHGEFKDKRIFNGNCDIYQKDSMNIISYKYGKGKRVTIIDRNYSKIKSIPKTDSLIHNKSKISDGYNKLFNEFKQVKEDGEFKNGKLLNGKKYIYDKNGLVDKIEIYKNGKYVGDAEID